MTDTTTWELPEYTAREFAPRGARHCVCVFVLNEGERIRAQLEKMRDVGGLVDIVIADGGSSDGALDPGFLEAVGVTTLLVKTSAGKLGTQMRMAFAHALAAGYDGVVTMDGNNKDDPEALGRFVRALDEGYDHVQGSRFLPGGESVNCPPSRLAGIRLVHAPLISLAAGFRYTDTTNGFRAYSRRLLTDPRMAPFRHVFAGYELHYYLAIRAARLGFRVCEVPVARRYPAHGPVPTKISPVKGNLKVLATLFRACLGTYTPR